MNTENWLSLILTVIIIGLATLALLVIAEVWQLKTGSRDKLSQLIVPWALDVIACGLSNDEGELVDEYGKSRVHEFTLEQLSRMRSSLLAAKDRGRQIRHQLGGNAELKRLVSNLIDGLVAQANLIDGCIKAVPAGFDDDNRSGFNDLLTRAVNNEDSLVERTCDVIQQTCQIQAHQMAAAKDKEINNG